ncbi:uncharacterized protein LOC110642449 [Hevea brasiliensis]|uniref:uncharacterized protein LOC110642449 n=1 Tax=Hevea brasiliensis TaxID=3981 RepID=UPI0025FD047B|nr:uncharacterized protein LOC110642449 [Hevea brasiliensis]
MMTMSSCYLQPLVADLYRFPKLMRMLKKRKSMMLRKFKDSSLILPLRLQSNQMIFRSMATGILEMFRSDCCIPEAAVVSVGHGYEAYVMELRVKARPPPQQACSSNTAPLLDSSHQALIDLVTVLDVSGSMIGAKL